MVDLVYVVLRIMYEERNGKMRVIPKYEMEKFSRCKVVFENKNEKHVDKLLKLR